MMSCAETVDAIDIELRVSDARWAVAGSYPRATRAEVEDSGAVNQIAVAAVAMSGEVDCDEMGLSASWTVGTQRREWSTLMDTGQSHCHLDWVVVAIGGARYFVVGIKE